MPASPQSSGTVIQRQPGISLDLGAEVAESSADAARGAAIVVTMVTDADAVLAIARDQGMLASLVPDAIWVQMSTIGVAGIKRVQSLVEAERPDVVLIDAPVSGSKEPAEQGQLTIFASGPERGSFAPAPLFDAVGQRTIWVGPVGAGSRLKLVANAWLALAAEAVNTSVALARRLGLETETVVNALGGGPLVSPWQAAKLERIAQGDFQLSLRCPSRSRTCVSLSKQPATSASGRLPPWPTNGKKSSILGSAIATSRSLPGHSSNRRRALLLITRGDPSPRDSDPTLALVGMPS